MIVFQALELVSTALTAGLVEAVASGIPGIRRPSNWKKKRARTDIGMTYYEIPEWP